MSDFRTLKGLFIKHVSSDPSNLGAGDIWYNTSTQTLKVATSIGAWASGGNCNQARSQLPGQHVGSQTAALSIGGNSPAGNYGALCEEYDGTDWAATDPLTTARSYLAGFGIQTAAVAAGGSTSPASAVTEEYNGTSWANGEDMVGTDRYGATGTGTLTAGLAVGGYHSYNLVEEYDGTDWTAVTAIPAAKHGVLEVWELKQIAYWQEAPQDHPQLKYLYVIHTTVQIGLHPLLWQPQEVWEQVEAHQL